MKKMIYLLLVLILAAGILAACSASGSLIDISMNGAPELREQTFFANSDSITFTGTVSAIGTVTLRVLSPDGNTLYESSFTDVRNDDLSVELTGLAAQSAYTLVLDGRNAISCRLRLSTDQSTAKAPPAVSTPPKPAISPAV